MFLKLPEPMTDPARQRGFFGSLFLWGLLVFLLCLISIFLGFHMAQPVIELEFHLFAGWFFFLRRNLQVLSMDSDVWIPGVVALVIAVSVAHVFLRGWAGRRGKPWPFGNSVALMLLLPLLFAISFLFPGVLLQAKQLGKEPWVKHGNASPSAVAHFLIHSMDEAVRKFAKEQGGAFPPGLPDLSGDAAPPLHEFFAAIGPEVPAEAPIYLGAGFAETSDPSLPLLISPAFSGEKGHQRYLLTIGRDQLLIGEEETDAWIQRSLDARPVEAR